MVSTLEETVVIPELAEALYPFLPANPHPYSRDKHLSLPGVAAQLGLESYWIGGSKKPALTSLLDSTLRLERHKFCDLIFAIVRAGIMKRKNKQEEVTREEIVNINGLLQKLGYKIPELCKQTFLDTLPTKAATAAPVTRNKTVVDLTRQAALNASFLNLTNSSVTPQQRGFLFEDILSELFALYELAPRKSFRNTGEQIDGSFEFNAQTYLLEAKWQNEKIRKDDLVIFSGKVGDKADWCRGLLISISGFSDDGLSAFAQGRRTNLICFDGMDLALIFSGGLNLTEVVTKKLRRAAETNRCYVPVRELFTGVI